MMDLKMIPTPRQSICVRQAGDVVFFLSESGEEAIDLNPVGSFIWQQMDGNHSLKDILDVLCHEYEVPEDTAQEDLVNFTQDLLDKDLISLEECGS